MHDEPESSHSEPSEPARSSRPPKRGVGRWAKALGGGRQELSREDLEREAAAEIGFSGGARPSDAPHEPSATSGRPAAPERRARRSWSRLRDTRATESDAARRERLEREAAEEIGFDPGRPAGDDDDA